LIAQKRSKKGHQQNQLQNFQESLIKETFPWEILQFALFISNSYLFSMASCNASHVLDPNRTLTEASYWSPFKGIILIFNIRVSYFKNYSLGDFVSK
jgi:hypothetical protein